MCRAPHVSVTKNNGAHHLPWQKRPSQQLHEAMQLFSMGVAIYFCNIKRGTQYRRGGRNSGNVFEFILVQEFRYFQYSRDG